MINTKSDALIEYESLKASNAKFTSEFEEAAQRVIRSGWYVLGHEVSSFEKEFGTYVGAKHCIGVANGMDAITLSIEALCLPLQSEIILAANTYIATILSVIQAGHKPVLVEPSRETFNIDPKHLKSALTSRTKAICVTHLFGKVCRMDEVCAFAREYGLKVIEDCAQSHGARLERTQAGVFGEAGCFSFYPTKNLGCLGDGGAVVTNNDDIADRVLHLRNYGSRTKYVNEYIGYNSRLDELQAAFLRIKLRDLDEIIRHKRELAEIYFSELPSWVDLPRRRPDEFDVFHIFGIRVTQRDQLRDFLLSNGIKTEVHYPIPPHKQRAMFGILQGNYPITEELHQTELSLPISFGHTTNEIRRVCSVIKQWAAN